MAAQNEKGQADMSQGFSKEEYETVEIRDDEGRLIARHAVPPPVESVEQFEAHERWQTAMKALGEWERAEKKFPNQHLPLLGDPYSTGSHEARTPRSWFMSAMENEAKVLCEVARAAGELTWWHVIQEEFFEAFAETDYAKAEVELVQLAAMALRAAHDVRRHRAHPAVPADSDTELRAIGGDLLDTEEICLRADGSAVQYCSCKGCLRATDAQSGSGA